MEKLFLITSDGRLHYTWVKNVVISTHIEQTNWKLMTVTICICVTQALQLKLSFETQFYQFENIAESSLAH